MVCMCVFVCGGTILHSVPRKKRIKRQKKKAKRKVVSFHLAHNLVPATAESPKGPKSVYMRVCVCLCAFGGRGIKSVKSLSVLELKCSERSVH